MDTGKDIVQGALSHYSGRPGPPAAGRPKARGVPDYAGLKIFGWLHIIFGFIWFLVGLVLIVIVLVGALVAGTKAAREAPSLGGEILGSGGVLSIVIAVAAFLGGIAEIGFGQLLLAIRDMARNSFWLR
ncbi:MAG: hypothetical protein FJ288_19035 [Planctomycetes bacterium]|nr:hypothetical protein [Planctomycetota bacterium]